MRKTFKLHIMWKLFRRHTCQHYAAVNDIGTGSVLQLAYKTKDIEEMQPAFFHDVQQYTRSSVYGFSDWPGIHSQSADLISFHQGCRGDRSMF